MEKYSRLTALTLAALILIATGVFGLFLILSIYPIAALLSDTDGKVFFVGGLFFFWLTLITTRCFRNESHLSYNLLAAHLITMVFGVVYFDWRFIMYLPIIIVYAIPSLISRQRYQQHNKSLNTDAPR